MDVNLVDYEAAFWRERAGAAYDPAQAKEHMGETPDTGGDLNRDDPEADPRPYMTRKIAGLATMRRTSPRSS